MSETLKKKMITRKLNLISLKSCSSLKVSLNDINFDLLLTVLQIKHKHTDNIFEILTSKTCFQSFFNSSFSLKVTKTSIKSVFDRLNTDTETEDMNEKIETKNDDNLNTLKSECTIE